MRLDINYLFDFHCRVSARGVPLDAEYPYKASNKFEPYKNRFENLVFIEMLSSY